jgi:hypothetical protein
MHNFALPGEMLFTELEFLKNIPVFYAELLDFSRGRFYKCATDMNTRIEINFSAK